ncbi:MAG: hypothetical protein XD54_0941 [Thermococcus sibiricus]|uniref:Uncharacterized protein n=1 Tax=Thermococcus sibiricus TaxID=172049 RepID=A0A124FFD5_9EURY|nr:MAG: hypothetical protein XD54_0941 [Thermococcus sibiricus]
MNFKILKSIVWLLTACFLVLYLCNLIDDYTFRIVISVGTGVFLARNRPTLWNFIKLVALLTGLLLGYFLLPSVFL